jgi:hypothetical protein
MQAFVVAGASVSWCIICDADRFDEMCIMLNRSTRRQRTGAVGARFGLQACWRRNVELAVVDVRADLMPASMANKDRSTSFSRPGEGRPEEIVNSVG